jgi:hypothetical protein
MGLYLPLIRLTAPDGCRELQDRVGNILGLLPSRGVVRAAAAAL